jgi:hypothetical protein
MEGFRMFVGKRVGMVASVLVLLNQQEISAQSSFSQPANSEPYVWHNVAIGGGGFVTGVFFHPRQKGLMYARTDVGGAYRWDDTAGHWTPITDWIGDLSLTGIESLAVDPADPHYVYLAAGIYSRGNAAILRSNDEGHTWQSTDVPFKMGGNELGRFNGERLAVDPNDGRILFFGSRRDGLWKSTDRAVTWQKVESFPVAGAPVAASPGTNNFRRHFNFGPQAVGIVFVLFDGWVGSVEKPTPVIYAGVSDLQTNLFGSMDYGNTWHPVPGQPAGLRPNHAVMASDGAIYVSYGKEPGPNTMTDGAVWKYYPSTETWTDITPLRSPDHGQTFGYGAVAVDPQHSDTVTVTTFCRWKPHDEIFRSTNGGASWKPLLAEAHWDYSQIPYTATRVPHWMGSIQIDPFDSNHVLFTTGYGIWSCDNLTDADAGKPTRWSFADAGLEETVPLALISPPEGAHLVSGLGDIDGFRHDDLNVSPRTGTFAGPNYANTEDLAFAGRNPQIIVRTGTGGHSVVHAAISLDGGDTWKALASEPDGDAEAGSIAISADGKTIVWTPRRGRPNYSIDCGTNWTACGGISSGVRVVADSENALRFYVFDPLTRKLLASTNGAASFTATQASFPPAAEPGRGFRFGGGDAVLTATPGREGDLWLALHTGGLWHSKDGGGSFARLEPVQQGDSLGFGKAAPGIGFPSLYLSGKIGGVQGLFRSDDSGATWLRINDAQHEYGAISHVTGDPRIYGRVYFATSGRGIIYGDPAGSPK